ncbi:MAG: T9SS type A sorting domain-containing protein, partial [Ferruginibacter sp.]
RDDGGTVVRLRQTYLGLPVNNNAEITLHINPKQKIDFVMNGFQYGININTITPVVSAANARQQVIDYLGVAGTISFESNQLMILQHQGTTYLVHHVQINTDQPVGEWDAYIDAKTGAKLKIEDVANYHHKKESPRFKPLPFNKQPLRATVNGTGFVFDPDPLSTAVTTYAGSYVDGTDANNVALQGQLISVTLPDITLTAGVYSLVGPYAVILDFEAPNKGLFTQASSTFNFNRSDDAFEAVNTYYHIDAAMRYLNVTLGLSIMPYQYTGGVRFDPSGLSGADNSHYLGSTGRLAFGEGGVDDAEDADVIIHELGHGLHDWVTSGGLSQVNGLSEGTGDYWAGSYSRSKGNWPTANAAYNWTFNWDGHNPFWGGRVLNYSSVYPGGLVSQIHTDGQIWATSNMKIWDDIGRQRSDKVFWSGLALTNGSSSQNDAAVAVYQMAATLGYTNAERLAIHTRYTAAGYTLPVFVLPVQLSKFSAQKNGASVAVNWITETEQGTNRFVIERSDASQRFVAIGTIAAHNNTTTTQVYDFVDAAPLKGKNYYRLRTENADGSFDYSKTVLVQYNAQNSLQCFPNPIQDRVTIKHGNLNGAIWVYDVSGKVLMRKNITPAAALAGQTILDCSAWATGSYVVKLKTNTSTLETTIIKGNK